MSRLRETPWLTCRDCLCLCLSALSAYRYYQDGAYVRLRPPTAPLDWSVLYCLVCVGVCSLVILAVLSLSMVTVERLPARHEHHVPVQSRRHHR